MTLQASSSRPIKARRFNPWAHSFWQAAREGSVVTVLSLLIYVGLFGVSFLMMASDARLNHAAVSSLGKYYLFSPQLSYFLPAVFLIAAMVMGAVTFRFLFHRNSANAWLNMGLTRGSLFLSRFLAGLAGVLLPIAASMAAMLAVNLVAYPDTGLVLIRWAQMTAGLIAQAGAFYVITAAICVSVGTMAEGMAYSLIAACLPSALLMGLNALMVGFLPGCAVGAPQNVWSGFTPELVTNVSSFNPLLFLYQYIGRYAAESVNAAVQVSALPSIGWLIAAAAVAFLAHRLFKARRAEIAGAMGSNRPLGFAAIFVAAFFAFSAPFMLVPEVANLPVVVLMLIAALLFAAAFLILAFPLKLVGMPAWKGLLALPAGLAVMFAVVGALASGGFGYSGYVPGADDVTSVSVSYSGIPAYAVKHGWGSGGGIVMTVQFESMIKLEDPHDIAAAVGLHKAFVDAGKLTHRSGVTDPAAKVYFVRFWVKYVLKDGRTVSRLYPLVNRELMLRLTAIDGLAGAKAAFRSHITNTVGSSEDWETLLSKDTYLSSRLLDRTAPLSMDEAQKKELLACIADDVTAQSVEDRYFPAKPEVCVLGFADTGESMSNGLPDWPERVVVTESFVKTIQFLTRNGMLDAVSAPADVDFLEVQNMFNNANYRFSLDNNYGMPLFMNSMDSTQSIAGEKGLLKITDAAQVSAILQSSRAQYLAADGGYFVYIHYKGSDFITSAFLPMKDAPDYIKQNSN